MNPSDLIIPLLLAGAAACGTGRRVNVYAALTRGAEDGLTVLLHVIPALVGLLTAVSMFRASGAMDALARLCAPVLNLLGIPAETVPLMLVRPVSVRKPCQTYIFKKFIVVCNHRVAGFLRGILLLHFQLCVLLICSDHQIKSGCSKFIGNCKC